MREGEGEGEGEREGEENRQTDGQTDRRTDGRADRQSVTNGLSPNSSIRSSQSLGSCLHTPLRISWLCIASVHIGISG